MAQDTLQYRLLILNFIFLCPLQQQCSLRKHLFIDLFWKMVIKETRLLLPKQRYFGLKGGKQKMF